MERRWQISCLPNFSSLGRRVVVSILTVSHQSTCPSWQLGNRDPDTTPALYGASTTARIRVLREEGTIFRKQLTNLQLFNVNKDESFPMSFNNSESGTAKFNEQLRSDLQRQKWDLESQLVACILLIFKRLVEVRNMARTTTRRMATQVVLTPGLFSKHFFFCKNCWKFVVFLCVYRR